MTAHPSAPPCNTCLAAEREEVRISGATGCSWLEHEAGRRAQGLCSAAAGTEHALASVCRPAAAGREPSLHWLPAGQGAEHGLHRAGRQLRLQAGPVALREKREQGGRTRQVTAGRPSLRPLRPPALGMGSQGASAAPAAGALQASAGLCRQASAGFCLWPGGARPPTHLALGLRAVHHGAGDADGGLRGAAERALSGLARHVGVQVAGELSRAGG